MAERDWADAGHGWQGKERQLRLKGWSRQRRVVLLRRRLPGPWAGRPRRARSSRCSSFAEVGADRRGLGVCRAGDVAGQRDPHARPALSRSRRLREHVRRTEEPVGLGWLHDTRSDALPADGRHVALIYNWWTLFVRLADPDHHREAITSRPLLMHGDRTADPACRTSDADHHQHARRAPKARRAYRRIAGFLASCAKLRSSWTRCNDGTASSARRCERTCTGANSTPTASCAGLNRQQWL